MIRLVSTAIHSLGLSSVRFNINGQVYDYESNAYRINTCLKVSDFSNTKALNYIKKYAVNTIKINKKD